MTRGGGTWLGPWAAGELHHFEGLTAASRVWAVLPSLPRGRALLGAGDFLVQPVDMGVGCQEGPVAHGRGSAGLLQQLPLSTRDTSSLWGTRCSSLACPGHAEHGDVPVLPPLEWLWWQPALSCSPCCSHGSALSSLQYLQSLGVGWSSSLGCLSETVLGLFP